MNSLNTKEGYEFSISQKSIWSLKQNINHYYNELVIRLDNQLDDTDLLNKLQAVAGKHEALISRGVTDSNSIFPYQVLAEDASVDLYSCSTAHTGIQDITLAAGEYLDQNYDPATSCPVRCCLVRFPEKGAFLFIRLYALWADSYSTISFYQELYNVFFNTAVLESPEDAIKYRDFSQWQNDLIAEPDEEGAAFWKQYKFSRLENIIPFGRRGKVGFSPSSVVVNVLDGEHYTKAELLCTTLHTNFSNLFMSLFGRYLANFSGDELTIGYIPFERSYKELDATIGLVSRTLPVKLERQQIKKLTDAINYVQQALEEVQSWGDYFHLDETETGSFFPYSFEYVKAAGHADFELTHFSSVTDSFLIKLFCVDYGDRISLELYYDQVKFNATEIEILTAQLKHQFGQQLEISAGAPLVSLQERLLIGQANHTRSDYDLSQSVLTLFEDQAFKNPGHIAVSYEDKRLTYRELDVRSNQLAHELRTNWGVKPGDLVALMMERSEWMIVALLAVMKTGAGYVPIDQDYPEERIAYILKDAGVSLLLNEAVEPYLDEGGLITLNVAEQTIYERNSEKALPVLSTMDGIAYIIYTSGSTGKPKGCIISHQNLSNYIQWCDTHYFGTAEGNWALLTSISFDLTVTSLYTSLTRGKTLFVGSKGKDIATLLEICFNHPEIDTLKLTPAHLHLLKGMTIPQTSIRTLICGGEQLTKEQISIVKAIHKDIRIFNEYGPTETTVGAVVKEVFEEDEKVLIGQPIGNTIIYILDENYAEVPVGVLGEIYIGGAGVGQGYLNQPLLTAERFITYPVDQDKRVYKTGDLGRWLPDGNIEFSGRKDDQVKVRGYRIEPGEIEIAISSYEGVAATVVVTKNNYAGEKELVAYLVGETALQVAALRNYLLHKLPEYMMPDHFVQLEVLPLTVNGKVDKEKLPDPENTGMQTGIAFLAPRNAIESKLVQIWEEVLGKKNIGVKDNFLESGGHSLKATRLVSAIHKVFEVKLLLKDLFAKPVLEDQAELIRQLGKTSFSSILPVAAQPHFALSSSQRRLWILSQLEEGNVAYNMFGVFVFEGALDLAALNYSFLQLMLRHESLRTVFREVNEDGEIRQFIQPVAWADFKIVCSDLRAVAQQENKIKKAVENEFTKPFDLATGPLIRAGLLQTEENKWIFTYVMHHIISDGWSMGILMNELLEFYNAYIKGEEAALIPLRIQYKDYAAWQQEQLKGTAFQLHKEYWLKQFEGELPVLELPGDKLRPAIKTYNGSIVNKMISAQLSESFHTLIQEHGSTLFMGLLALVNTLLYRYTNQKDIIIGSPVAGRDHADLEDQIGFYVNTIALRSNFKGSDSYLDLLENAKQTTLNAFEHQGYPFDELIDELRLQRDVSRSPLFDVMMVVQHAEYEKTQVQKQLDQIKVTAYEDGEQLIHKFDLTFNFVNTNEGLLAGIEYNSDIYDRETIIRLSSHLEQLLAAIVQVPAAAVQDIDYLSAAEKKQLLETFNLTDSQYLRGKTTVELFEEQVSKTPENTALVFNGRELTYAILNEKVNALAAYLREKYAIHPDDLVGIVLERSEWMIISILAVLKAGGAYVPVDPAYPQDRIDYLIADSGCKLIIDQVELDQFKTSEQLYGKANLTRVNKSSDLAYVIYTSGTTGNPKGVMIAQESLNSRISYFKHMYKLTEADKLLFYRSYSFDGSIEEYLLPVLTGATCFIAPTDFKQDLITNLTGFIEKHQITKVNMPPVLLGEFVQLADQHMLERLSSLQHVVSGGDKLTLHVITNYLAKFSAKLYNSYGPTENTVDSTNWIAEKGIHFVPIGKPVPDSQAFILDEHGKPVPVGVCGELYVSGSGLARGYLNQPALTAEKFVTNPFLQGKLMYKTGDVVRWLPDGNIEFFGRKDDQVKIRGFRIEIGEIEAALHMHPAIEAAVVVARSSAHGDKNLVAYMVSKTSLEASEIRAFLSKTLPVYMLPHYYVQLEALPLTVNGKTDKKGLPDPEIAGLGTGVTFVAPRNKIERELVSVFEGVLKKQTVSIKDDFFELGGDSIKSIQIVSRLKQRGYVLTIRDILMHPVLEELAGYVHGISRNIEQGSVAGIIPLSPVQESFFQRTTTDHAHYNQSVLLESKGKLSEEGLQAVLNKIMLHHDMLRAVYRESAYGWIQENKDEQQQCLLEVITVTSEIDFNNHCDRIQSGFDLENGPLFRAVLFHHPEGDYLLLIAHHLVIDGVSWRILFEDLSALYQQYQDGAALMLPLKTDSFSYWQQQQQQFATTAILQSEEEYWSAIEAVPVKPLPVDHAQGSNLVKDTAAVAVLLNSAITGQLMNNCYSAYHTEINDILLTALSLALKEVFKTAQVLISLEGHGREYIGSDTDVTRTAGWFTTVYPVLFELSDSFDRIRQLIAVKEHLHRIPNKGIGYGVLRYLAGKEYRVNPELTFNYLGDFDKGITGADDNQLFVFSGKYRGAETSENMEREAVLNVAGMVVDGQLRLSIAYSKQQYEASTIQGLADSFEKQLIALAGELSSIGKTYLTPVDLTWKSLSVEQLMELNKQHNIEDVYPLSPLQEGLYFHWLKTPAAPVYFEQTSYRVKGDFDIDILEKSYAALVDRHAALRTVFTQDLGDLPLQIVYRDALPSFEFLQMRADRQEEDVSAYKVADRSFGFNLHTAVPVRLAVLGLNDGQFEFIWSHHHILMDGWCGSILIKEFFELYYDLAAGKAPVLSKVYPYSGYIDWLMKRDHETALHYWKDYLAGYDTLATLPQLPSASVEPDNNAVHQLVFALEGALRYALRESCSTLGITENTFIQTAWGLLLSKYNNTDDVIFGAVVSGRPAELKGVEEMIGLFINTIPVRIQSAEGVTVTELLRKTQETAIAGVTYHYTQLARIQSLTDLGGNLFDHVLVFENYPVQEMVKQSVNGAQSAELTLLSAEIFEQANYDFSLMVVPGDAITFQFNYKASKYDRAQMQRLEGHLKQIIIEMLNGPEITLREIDYLSTAEKEEQLLTFNGAAASYPTAQTLAELFEEKVAECPDQAALICGEATLTYQELNAQSNQLAHYLRENYQLKSNDLVSIQLDRNENLIIAILAVLKAGGAYVPMDTAYPKERITYMLTDSQCKLVLDEELLLQFNERLQPDKKENLTKVSQASDLAYVIYTSGSTGKPKGVLIQHSAIVNTIYAQQEIFEVKQGENHLQFSSSSFDASVSEIFVALLSGGILHLVDETVKMNPSLFEEYLHVHQIDIATIPPAYLKLLDIEKIRGLKKLITAGEPAVAETAHDFSDSGTYYNAYGPTESSICAAVYQVNKTMAQVPIGTPIPNTQLYITDEYMNLMPLGATGEICISGHGLALGYLNNASLTADKFIANPFSPDTRLYKTGDLGRWMPDGNLLFTGRKDDQVKIRGYRIELGEIENEIINHPEVTAATVIARENIAGERNLVAYVVGNKGLNTTEIRTHLSKKLPAYMLPAYYVSIAELPITINGKVDRKRLPDPEDAAMDTGAAYVAPRNEIETQLVHIWQELLGKDKVSIQDNFFDIGGNSILMIRLAKAVSRVLEKEISIALLFQYSNIKDLVNYYTNEAVVVEEEIFDKDELMADLNKLNFNYDDDLN